MVDVRLAASGAIRLRWYPQGAFVNYKAPTVAELNAGTNIADAVSWNDYSFGLQASNTSDDPAITNKSNVQTRGATQFGGTLSFYYPKVFGDTTNIFNTAYELLKTPTTYGYIVTSIDGDLSANTTPLYTNGAIINFADGGFADYLSVFKVVTGGYTESIVGEEAFRYSVNFLSQGEVSVYTVARTAAVTVVASPATSSGTIAGNKYVQLNATANGRRYTRGMVWSTSNPTIATVSGNGVVTRVAVGTATITATFPATGASATVAVTNT